ncbi:AraC family transcriptional regulator, partial [Roseomonas alkaliterrae]|nr:AraC family transcriptional regulator [Neoroseomonas alkaliterrae]
AVGYASAPAFGAAFRAAFGTTPGAERIAGGGRSPAA